MSKYVKGQKVQYTNSVGQVIVGEFVREGSFGLTWAMWGGKDHETSVHTHRVSAVNSITEPHHYHKGGIDVIEFCKDKLSDERQAGFFQMNILKYVTRYTEKNGVGDLKKALVYLNKLIELEEKE